MELTKKLKGQEGFAIISAVVAGTIGAVIIATLTSAIVGFQNETKKLNQTLELNRIKSELSHIWSDSTNCKETFGGVSISFNGEYAPSVSAKAQRRSISKVGGVELAEFNKNNTVHLKDVNFQLISGDPSSLTFVAKLELIPFDMEGDMIDYIKPKQIFVDFKLDASSNILTCESEGGSGSGSIKEGEFPCAENYASGYEKGGLIVEQKLLKHGESAVVYFEGRVRRRGCDAMDTYLHSVQKKCYNGFFNKISGTTKKLYQTRHGGGCESK